MRRLPARLEHPLHAQTNSEQRNLPVDRVHDRFLQSSRQRGCGFKIPHARQNDLAGPRDRRRVGGDRRLVSEMVKRFFHRGKISGLIVNDGDHSNPFVLGNRRAIRRSRQQAARNARAKALNNASIL